jgi:hypothetical protein
MPTWMILAKGPAFFFVLTLFVLGMFRLLVLTVWDIAAAVRRARDRRIPYAQLARQTLSWLLPLTRLNRARAIYSMAAFGLHLGILFGALFLRNHLDILRTNLGFTWSPFPKPLLDFLTVIGIVGAAILLFSRIYLHNSRQLSKLPDYLLLILLLNIFVSGFVAGRSWNPIPYDGLMLFHTLNGMAILAVGPFTKIAHCILFPLIRLGSEVAWHFTPQGGSRVVETLHGSEGRQV